MKQLIIIPCCSKKVTGGTQINQGLTFFENINNVPELINRRNERINLVHLDIQEEELLPAWDRYDGRIYRRLKEHQALIDTLIAQNKLDIIIISALYGVINIKTPIANYNLEMKALGGVNFWRFNNILGHSMNEYCLQNDIENIYTFLTPGSYYSSVRGLREHIQIWPEGLRGPNNINNHSADLIVQRLMQISEL
jgi:hypothetical protein